MTGGRCWLVGRAPRIAMCVIGTLYMSVARTGWLCMLYEVRWTRMQGWCREGSWNTVGEVRWK